MLAKGKISLPLPESRVAVDHHMRVQSAPRAQHNVLADDAVRPDLAIARRSPPWDG